MLPPVPQRWTITYVKYKSHNKVEYYPMLIKWRKNKIQKFLPGTILKIMERDLCQWRVPVRYYVAIQLIWKLLGVTKITHAETHKGTHRKTEIQTPTRRHIDTIDPLTQGHTDIVLLNYYILYTVILVSSFPIYL